MKHTDNEKAPSLPPDIADAVSALGRVLSTAAVYGMDHPRSRKEVDTAHQALQSALTDRKRIRLDLIEGRLFVDGNGIEKPTPMLRVITARMTSLRITGFSVMCDLDVQGLGRLLELLANGKAGAFENDLAKANIAGVQAEKREYRAVRPDEKNAKSEGEAEADAPSARPGKALRKDGRDATGPGGGSPGDVHILDLDSDPGDPGAWSPPPSSSDPSPHRPAATEKASEIIAFLRGEPGGSGGASEIAKMMSDPEKLAELIMDAAAVRQTAPGRIHGESMADLILGCLRRTYEGIKKSVPIDESDDAPTIRQSLLLLERNILERFRTMMRPADPNTEALIRSAVREMDEELELDTAAAHYVEQRAALVRSERRIVEYLQTKGADKVEPHAQAAGLSGSEWKRLCARSGVSAEPEKPGTGAGDTSTPAGLGTLALILERFDTLMRQDQKSPEDVRAALAEVEAGMEAAVEETVRNIEALEPNVHLIRKETDREAAGGGRRLLEQLASISQELLQPLTVINCSLQMLLDGFLGVVEKEQREVITLSSESGVRMKELMDGLISVVGYPRDPKIPGTSPLEKPTRK